MNIDFELYRIFYVVANHCNITKASEELSISQPAISKSIKNLEEQLGGQLFVRTKRGVVLTEEGKEFYNYIKQAIEYINNAENKFTDLINLETGCIKIGISTTLTKEFLLPYLEEFHSLYPKIDIQIITNLTSDLMPKLRNGLIDIVILNLNDKNYGNDIDIIKCRKINDCFVVNNKYKDLTLKEVSIKDLNNYPLILQKEASNTRKFLDNLLLAKGIRLVPKMEVVSQDLIMEFANIGLGFGFGFVDLAKEKYKNLQEIDLNKELPSTSVYLGVNKDMSLSFASKTFIKYLK